MDRLIAESTNTPGLNGLFAYEDYASAQQPVIFLNARKSRFCPRALRMHGMQNFVDGLETSIIRINLPARRRA